MDAKAKREARKERETQRLIKKIRALQERLHRRSLKEHQRQEKARNPMAPSVWIGLGVLAAGLTTLGIYEHYKSPGASAGVPAGCTPLQPGTMPAISLSMTYASGGTPTSANQASYCVPVGATLVSAQQTPSSTSTIQVSASPGKMVAGAAPVSGTSWIVGGVTLSALAGGQPGDGSTSVTWTDANGSTQTSTIPVTVTA